MRCACPARWRRVRGAQLIVTTSQDQEDAVKVSRLILAGNSLARPDIGASSEEPKKVRSLGAAVESKRREANLSHLQKTYGYDSSLYTAKPTEALDALISELATSVPVDLMPGETDPTEPTMPQQPMHHALLPNSALYEGFTGRTNPFWCEVGGARCVVLFLDRFASRAEADPSTVAQLLRYVRADDR